jgi:hypothetical protein
VPNDLLNTDPEYGLPHYLGKNGVYDGGDCCANTFSVNYANVVTYGEELFPAAFFLLTTADGWPVRSPDSSKWYGRRKRCSRDQLTPYLCYAAITDDKYFYSLLGAMTKHAFCLANNSIRNFVYEDEQEHLQKSTPDVKWRPKWKLPDLLGPDIWQIWARGLILRNKAWNILRPIVWLGDLQNFLAVLPYVFKPRVGITDERNLALKVHFAANFAPTILSKYTYKLYQSTKPQEAFTKFWTQPGEPAVHIFMNRLYSKD